MRSIPGQVWRPDLLEGWPPDDPDRAGEGQAAEVQAEEEEEEEEGWPPDDDDDGEKGGTNPKT